MGELSYRLGCDIGGTFTDFILLNRKTGEMEVKKLLTTPHDPSKAVLDGVQQFLDDRPHLMSDMENVIHGTTLIINAIIERKGAVTALITTRGFRDILEIGREKRYDIYDMLISFPPPLVPRHLRKEVKERINRDGMTLVQFDEQQAKEVAAAIKAEGVESVAVCFLHSFTNPENEQRMGKVLEEACPQLPYSLSSDVLPEIREYERTSTTLWERECSKTRGTVKNPRAEATPAARGTSIREIFSERARLNAWTGPAPPNATMVKREMSSPFSAACILMEEAMFSFTRLWMPHAASMASILRGLAI